MKKGERIMNQKWNKTFALFLILIFTVSITYTTVDAAEKANITISTAKSTESGYQITDSFDAYDRIYVLVDFSNIGNTHIGGLSFKLTYDTSVLQFDGSSNSTVEDKNAVFYFHDKEGTITFLWDTVSEQTVFDGTVFCIAFQCLSGVYEEKNITFKIEVEDFYNTKYSNIPYTLSTNVINAKILVETIPQSLVDAFQKLENITTESLNDIVAAETEWGNLSGSQQLQVMKKQSKLYTWYSTARTRYNQVVNQAGADKVLALVDEYTATYGHVLKLTTETVTIQNKNAIEQAQAAYGNLPTSVTTRLDQNIPKHFKELLKRVSALEDAQEEATYFKEEYNGLLKDTQQQLEYNFEATVLKVDEAVLYYEMMSPDAQNLVADLYKDLLKLKKQCDEIIANDKAMTVIREEVNEYQGKWIKILMLNPTRASLADKTAIEMAIADYDKLSEEAKEMLASKITNLKTILNKLTSAGTGNGTVGGNTQGGTTTKVVEKLVETEKTVTIIEYINKNIPKSIWILLCLLGSSILTLIWPLMMNLRYKKRLQTLKVRRETGEL